MKFITKFVGEWLQKFVEKAGEHIFSAIVAFIIGAVLTTLLFFFTSHQAPIEKLKADLQAAVRKELKSKAKQPDKVDFDFMDAYRLSLTADTIVMYGKFESVDVMEDYRGSKNAIFFAIFEDAPKSWLDSVVGRDADKALTGLITFNGIGDSRRIGNLKVEDVFKKGEKAILFDLIQEYASGSSISPIVAYKYMDGWKLTLLQTFDQDAQKSLENMIKEKKIRISKEFSDDLRGARDPEYPNITYLEDWTITLNGRPNKFVALRNSSGYKYFQHPEFGYKQMLIVDSYRDDATNAPHRVFIKVLKLDYESAGAVWRTDDTWNGGDAMVSDKPIHFDELDFEKLYSGGINKRDHVYYWGQSYGKEQRAR